MANFYILKAAISAAIKQNGNNEITGNLLQQQLLAMVNSLGSNYQYVSIATPTTNPGTPDQNVFYLASTAGTYTNFGGLVLDDGEIAILKYNGAWSKDSTGAASLEKVNQLGQETKRALGKKLKSKDDAESVTYHEILSDGNLSPTTSYNAYYFPNDNYGRVVATLGNNIIGNYAIAFYNTDTPSAESLIGGVRTQNAASYEISADVPDECVLIIVSNRRLTNPDPEIGIYATPAIVLQDNPDGGKNLMVGGYNAGTIPTQDEIDSINENITGLPSISLGVNKSRLPEIQWGKIFDIYGNISDDDTTIITPRIDCKQGDTIVVNAQGYKTGIVLILRNSDGERLDYWNLNVEKTINVSFANAAYFECSFLKSGYGATISINGKVVFTWTNEMDDYLSVVYKDTFAFESAISSIVARATKAIKNNSICFVHLTDTHSGYPNHMSLANAEKHMSMAMRLAERVKADFVVHTGDAIHGFSETAEPAMESYNALLKKIGNSVIPFIWAQGNPAHDFGYRNELTRAQVNTIMGRFGKWEMQNAVYGDTRSYYYFDMSRTPCRVLVLDPDDGGVNRLGYGFSIQQIDFVHSALSDALIKELPVAIFAHMPLTGKLMPPYSIDGSAIESEIKSYVDGGGRVLCYSFGHTHWDNYYYDKPNGIPYINLVNEFPVPEIIGTQPEWGHATGPSRKIGKLSEYAMDVYVVDVVSGTARIFRYGAGVDRISNIADFTASIGGMVTLTSELTSPSWSSLNEDIATVADGVVTGVSAGDAEIIATGEDGSIEFFKVTIN